MRLVQFPVAGRLSTGFRSEAQQVGGYQSSCRGDRRREPPVPRETTPSRLGSLSSANMTGVWNCSPSSLIVVSPTSTGSILPSAVSDGRILSTGTPRRWSICLGTAVGILHVVAAKKDGSDPALLVSGAVFCSRCKIPRLSRKMCPRARIYATYGRSVRAGAEPFPCLSVRIRRPWCRIFSVTLMSAVNKFVSQNFCAYVRADLRLGQTV